MGAQLYLQLASASAHLAAAKGRNFLRAFAQEEAASSSPTFSCNETKSQ